MITKLTITKHENTRCPFKTFCLTGRSDMSISGSTKVVSLRVVLPVYPDNCRQRCLGKLGSHQSCDFFSGAVISDFHRLPLPFASEAGRAKFV